MTLPEVRTPPLQQKKPLEVVTARHPLRWVAVAGVFVVLGFALGTVLALLYPRLSVGVPFGPAFFGFGTMDLIGPLTAAVLGLSLHQAAYAAEIVRGGLLSVDHGQREAAAALGLPPARRLFRIILPQAMRTIVPNAGNEIIGLVKGTSVVYIMALPEPPAGRPRPAGPRRARLGRADRRRRSVLRLYRRPRYRPGSPARSAGPLPAGVRRHGAW